MISKKKINDFEINPIGMGTWMIGGGIDRELGVPFADYDNDEESIQAIRYSIDQRQNHIDTAQFYGMGHSEEVVGKAIQGYDRSKLFIASKIWKSHTKRSAVVHQVEDMLRRLQTDYLDMIYIHSNNNPFPMAEYLPGLNDAVDKGLARGVAVSNFNLEEIKQAVSLTKHPILANQILYNILEKEDAPRELLRFCEENNIRIVAYRPVERKQLADQCQIPLVLETAEKYDKTPAQIAINWLISQDNVVTIPKAVQKEHIDENLGALEFELSQTDWDKLNSLA